MEDILARLKNGESVEDIAKEFADALNEAEKTYNEEHMQTVERAGDAAMIIEDIKDYMVKYHSDKGDIIQKIQEQLEKEDDDIIATVDAIGVSIGIYDSIKVKFDKALNFNKNWLDFFPFA